MGTRQDGPGGPMNAWQQPAAAEAEGDEDYNVKYLSTSKPKQSGFYCSLPPGSRHAATAQQICAALHTNRSFSGDTQPPALTQGSESTRLLKDVSAREEETRASKKSAWANSSGRASRGVARTSYKSPKARPMKPAQAPETMAPPVPPVAYKYEHGHQVAYCSQNSNGKLFVSAPKGTGEAEMFDNLAGMINNPGSVSIIL